jgi:hypothetical protein
MAHLIMERRSDANNESQTPRDKNQAKNKLIKR